MNKQEHEQLSNIHRRVYGYSAVIGVALNALEYQSTRNDDMDTAHIELVLQNLHYDLAAQCEELEKMLEAAQAKHEADWQAKQERQVEQARKEWIDQRVANIPPEAAKAFKAASAAYAQATPPEVPAPVSTDSQALLTLLLGMLKDWRKCEMSSTEFETNLEQAVSLASSLVGVES